MPKRSTPPREAPGKGSQIEIERMLRMFGATEFAYGVEEDTKTIYLAFECGGRRVRFAIAFPHPDEFWETKDAKGKIVRRTPEKHRLAYELAYSQRWHALYVSIRNKLDAVRSGISDFEIEFYPYLLMPGGRTLYEETIGDIEVAYSTGSVPDLLPQFRRRNKQYG